MTGICEQCGVECNAKIVDNGIGAYEYWGATGHDVQLCVESDCCGAEVINEDTNEIITVNDIHRYEDGEIDYYID